MISHRPFALELVAVALVLAAGGVLAAVGVGSTEQSYQLVEEDLEAFRTAFNAEPGNVRAVLLASPT